MNQRSHAEKTTSHPFDYDINKDKQPFYFSFTEPLSHGQSKTQGHIFSFGLFFILRHINSLWVI